jgi:hypothetical protein
MAGLRAIFGVMCLLYLMFVMGFGGLAYVVEKGEQQADRERAMSDEAGDGDSDRYAAQNGRAGATRYEREGVTVDPGSARPMVDVDPANRY